MQQKYILVAEGGLCSTLTATVKEEVSYCFWKESQLKFSKLI